MRVTYRTALNFENPLNITKHNVTAGLKWPPDVPLHTPMAKRMPKEYAKPICRAAESVIIREVYYSTIEGLTRSGSLKNVSDYRIHLRPNTYQSGEGVILTAFSF
jgi:hypothetical protein